MIGSMGYYNLLMNGVFLGVITHLVTVDPNFLGHPSSANGLLRKTRTVWMVDLTVTAALNARNGYNLGLKYLLRRFLDP